MPPLLSHYSTPPHNPSNAKQLQLAPDMPHAPGADLDVHDPKHEKKEASQQQPQASVIGVLCRLVNRSPKGGGEVGDDVCEDEERGSVAQFEVADFVADLDDCETAQGESEDGGELPGEGEVVGVGLEEVHLADGL